MADSRPSHLATAGDENPTGTEVNKSPYTQFAHDVNSNPLAKLFITCASLTSNTLFSPYSAITECDNEQRLST